MSALNDLHLCSAQIIDCQKIIKRVRLLLLQEHKLRTSVNAKVVSLRRCYSTAPLVQVQLEQLGGILGERFANPLPPRTGFAVIMDQNLSSGIEDLFDNERAHEAIGKLVEELQDAALKVVRVVQAMNRQLEDTLYELNALEKELVDNEEL